MRKLTLGERMRRYEEVANYRIMSRVPIIVRVDGLKFSKLTKRLKILKPFDADFSTCMVETAKFMATDIQGCVLIYTQSDEITLIIRTDQSNDTTPWFDNRIQKVVSVGASFATFSFARAMLEWRKEFISAGFDCRAFGLPNMTEVVNNLILRQRDCVRNSVSSAAYYEIGKKVGLGTAKKMIHGLNLDERQEKLFQETGINWNNYHANFKNGIVVFKEDVDIETEHGIVPRKKWVSSAAPTFASETGRAWLNIVLNPQKEKK